MSKSLDTSPIYDEIGAIGFDLTASEVATMIGSSLVGVALAVGTVAAFMLL